MKEINIFPSSYSPKDIKGISILDVKELSFSDYKGLEFSGISALAFEKTKGLYALSDRGNLFHLDLKVEHKKIQSLKVIKAMPLKNKRNKPLKHNDSEGMAISKEGLLISFERDPKVSLFSFDAKKIKNVKLPPVLNNIKNYKKKNKALEAVLIHEKFGPITIAETALKHEDKRYHTLYALDKRWKFKAEAKVTSIELMPSKKILVLEREFEFLKGHSIRLSTVDINNCKKGICSKQSLAYMQSVKGWQLDNFEGLTRLYDNVYVMISDDNANFMQRCLFVLFEVKS